MHDDCAIHLCICQQKSLTTLLSIPSISSVSRLSIAMSIARKQCHWILQSLQPRDMPNKEQIYAVTRDLYKFPDYHHKLHLCQAICLHKSKLIIQNQLYLSQTNEQSKVTSDANIGEIQ